MNDYSTTYHKDKTVTVWNCYTQQWERGSYKSLRGTVIASVSLDEFHSIKAHCEGVLSDRNAMWYAHEALDMRMSFRRHKRSSPVKVGRGLWLGISYFGQPFRRGKHWDADRLQVRLYSTQAAAKVASVDDEVGESGCLSLPIE